MKWVTFALALWLLGSCRAEAGVNSGGVLVVHDPGVLFTSDSSLYCGQGSLPTQCDPTLDTRIDGAISPATAAVWKVYAAFSSSASPRLKAVAWGITYPPAVVLLSQGLCGDFEVTDSDWPASNSGCGVVWYTTQTSRMVPVYWFAGYSYAPPASFSLRGPTSGGGAFGDDSVPTVTDDITAYGSLGFNQAGTNPCGGDGLGACCNPSTGSCSVVFQGSCQAPNVWHAEWTSCSPNPCLPAGTCCQLDGSCTITIEADCTGNWTAGGSCVPNPCPQAIGACCFTTTCLFIGIESCYSQGGTFMGYSSTCNPTPCAPSAVGDGIRESGDVALGPPVPNPSWGTVVYSVVLPHPANVRVSLLDVSGRVVRELLARQLSAGAHSFTWDPGEGRRLPSGLYALRLEADGSASRVRRLVLLR